MWIEAGDYVLGSDRKQRDYAYRISAQAVSSQPNEIAKEEKRLRRQGWFDREADRGLRSQSAVCIAQNLITNADYQIFVQETNHRPPFISDAIISNKGFWSIPTKPFAPIYGKAKTIPREKAKIPLF